MNPIEQAQVDPISAANRLAQAIVQPPMKSAIFLSICIKEGAEADALGALAGVSGLVNAVGYRAPEAKLTCVTGIGAEFWDRALGTEKPAGLHPFREVVGDKYTAPSTPGDVFFHIRSHEFDRCFELTRRIMDAFGDTVASADEVQAFRYMDNRDPLGFVDGTESPVDHDAAEAALITEGPWAGGSYIVEQKYTHHLKKWDALPVEEQEKAIGRTKFDDIEFDEDVKPHNSHVALNSVKDAEGNSLEIVRDNLAFGSAAGEQGTFFMSYAADVRVTELMLRRMFIGEPRGNYDRILDFSTALTGGNFFAPPQDFLDSIEDHAREGLIPESEEEANPLQPATELSAAEGLY
ncbi:Dyp-type peroxidase [Corynebacterium pyruviciproducens]